ncbi:UNVERIFIED_CONTAM: hypothetical protein Slati_3504300 [Sesamum latifolium]|uniref:Uncharacterized protein n=1 Tax=Sesamum latifolium TaxID=2727402 RepID=A0AAW2UHD8_9LAMI
MFDLEEQFAFYGAYHSNPVNILFHMMFVWPIAFTALLLLYFTPPLFGASPIELWDQSFLVLNYGFLFTRSWPSPWLFFGLEGCSGISVTMLDWAVHRPRCFRETGTCSLDNLAQAFLMAPYFVLLELLQSAFGYEPYPGFHASVKAKIDAEIKAWKDKKQKKNS